MNEEVKKTPRPTVQVAVDFELMNRLYALRAKLNAPDNRITVRTLVEEAINDLLAIHEANNNGQ